MTSRSEQTRAALVGGPACGLVYLKADGHQWPTKVEMPVEGKLHLYVAMLTSGRVTYRHARTVSGASR